MVCGIIIFQLGNLYGRYLKYQRTQKKLAKRNRCAKGEIHEKSCPKYSVNHCLTRESFLEEKAAKQVNDQFKQELYLNNEGMEDDNISDDSSNCEELDDDEGKSKQISLCN